MSHKRVRLSPSKLNAQIEAGLSRGYRLSTIETLPDGTTRVHFGAGVDGTKVKKKGWDI